MILQIIANAFVLNLALDAGSFEYLRITNAGQLKDLWRLDGAAGHHNFALHINSVSFRLVFEIDTNSLVTFQLHRGHRSFTQNV
jgi:hypothetical protein